MSMEHQLLKLVKQVEKTHRGLGPLIAMNILAAKAKKTILNVAPAGCGKSVACNAVARALGTRARYFTSITLAGLKRLEDELSNTSLHIIIDDLGAEKSMWSRISTITTLANLVHDHYVHKVTQTQEIRIEGFYGSVSLNVQPVLMYSLVADDDWVAVVRDKVIRYYHLKRPVVPNNTVPDVRLPSTPEISEVKGKIVKGRLWYQLVAMGLTQWSYARVIEHIPDLLKAMAALDNRTEIKPVDFKLLIKLLKPMQLERYFIDTYSFEQGRVFKNDLYCILVEIASFGEPTLDTICEDYKVAPSTARRLIENVKEWCFIKDNSPKRIAPTEEAKKLLDLCGVYDKW